MVSYVDSGAARSVCSPDHARQFAVVETSDSKNGRSYTTATGKLVQVTGGKTVVGKTVAGNQLAMRYVVAPASVTLDSVSQICDSGAEVHFNRSGGNIIDADGTKTGFTRVGDTYLRETWIERQPAAPLNRQSLSS